MGAARKVFTLGTLDCADDYTTDEDLVEVAADDPNAQLVSSLLDNGLHSPAIDIDFAARLVPSSTEGHFHLYLDGIQMDAETYAELLVALRKAGVIQEGIKRRWFASGMTLLRLPHVHKPKPGKASTDPLVVTAPKTEEAF